MTSNFVTKTGRKFSYTVGYFGEDPAYYDRQTAILDETNKVYYGQLLGGRFTSEKGSLNLTYSNLNGDHDYWHQKGAELFNYILHTEIDKLFALNIALSSNKLPLAHGGDGIIPMGHGGYSYYYSLTNLSLNGTFMHDGIVEPLHGSAWIDRQWGDWAHKGYGFDGWEWFAIRLNDNTEIMLGYVFDVRTRKIITPILSIMLSDGSSVNLSNRKEFKIQYLDYWEAPDEYRSLKNLFFKQYFSCGWKIAIPRYGIDLTIIPIVKNQRVCRETWEGSCYVTGTHNGIKIDGISTVELTHRYSRLRWLRFPMMQI
jgi:predicted secreted hydrolase